MDMNGKDNNVGINGSESKIVSNGESQKGVMNGERDEDDESKSLLSPRRGGLSKKSPKKPRKVQWNDTNGHNLTEVLEYQPRGILEEEMMIECCLPIGLIADML